MSYTSRMIINVKLVDSENELETIEQHRDLFFNPADVISIENDGLLEYFKIVYDKNTIRGE